MEWQDLWDFIKRWWPHIVSSGIGAGLWSLWTGHQKKKAEQDKDRTTRAAILSTFAIEAVDLQERWVQYDRQAQTPEISNSVPFEFTNVRQVEQLIQLATPREVIHAIYRIKELNAHVYSNVTRAQREVSQSIVAPISDDPIMAITSLPYQTFGSAAAFVRDRWADVCKAIRLLLDAAKRDGVDITSFLRAVEKNERDYRAQNPPPPHVVSPGQPVTVLPPSASPPPVPPTAQFPKL